MGLHLTVSSRWVFITDRVSDAAMFTGDHTDPVGLPGHRPCRVAIEVLVNLPQDVLAPLVARNLPKAIAKIGARYYQATR